MTGLEMDQLTLAELEAIAARFSAAVATIRDAQTLLGGGGVYSQAHVSVAAPMHSVRMTGVGPAEHPAPVANGFTTKENAERARLLKQIRGDEFPAAIAAAEEQ